MAERAYFGVAESHGSRNLGSLFGGYSFSDWLDEFEAESVYIQDDLNVENEVNVEDEVNVDDGVNVNDGANVDGGVSLSNGSLEPYIGMEFEDVEDAQTFYKAYAKRKGFAIRTNHTRLSKDDKTLCAVDYVCTRAGFRQVSRKEKDRILIESAETKIRCKAIMRIKEKKWIVNKFVVGHNHILLTPRSTSLLRGHRGVTKVKKKTDYDIE
ncbi:protein FAR1-RELATED SEQUENCE 5-like [Carya illinoinensis]|uniref:protein FAR1-RELATED SEQUENCE 5-like n=1 Tax=Carya illinoinensis TaxID=32201 RepID=UPI001C723A68|nr:protein FAR1-RELATED SEQUENCE 5-like [Carya illinoinensis]